MSVVKVDTTKFIVELESPNVYNVTATQPAAKKVIVQGLVGGVSGTSSGALVEFQAGENLSSGRVVYIENDQAFYYDPSNQNLAGRTIGITKTAASIGTVVTVVLSEIFQQSGLGLTPDSLYFVGVSGTLVTSVAGLAVVQSVGVSLSADKLKINFTSPIKTI